AWNAPVDRPIAVVKYVRLPAVARFEPGEIGPQDAEAVVVVSGQSTTPIKQITVSGDVLSPTAIKYDQATGNWQATIRKLRRREPYEIAVHAWNSDGQSLAP